MLRVLGADPGFKNLGLAVVEFSETGAAPVVLWSQDVYVGDADHPERYAPMLVPYLENVYGEWSFTAVAAETPPMIQKNLKTSCMLQRTFGVVDGWAACRGIPVQYRSPVALKAAARRVLGITDAKESSKGMMRAACEQILGGKARRTSHENDAFFAAWVCYGSGKSACFTGNQAISPDLV